MYYVTIDSFKHFRKSNVDHTDDRSMLYNAMMYEKGTTYEVLKSNYMRVFLDIENVPKDQPQLIDDIIARFITYARMREDMCYVLTCNTGSHHPGLSYHVIFGTATLRDNLKNLVKTFRKDVQEYATYVDDTIYTPWRLFRLPFQHGIADVDDEDYDGDKDVHEIMRYGGTCLTDNPLENDYIIQNTDTVDTYMVTWKPLKEEVVPKEELRSGDIRHDKDEEHDDTNGGVYNSIVATIKSIFNAFTKGKA